MAPTRIRLSIQQKVKIIEESKKSGFKREKFLIEYGIGKATLSALLKNQKQTLETYEKGLIPANSKTCHQAANVELEKILYDWFLIHRRKGLLIDGPLIRDKALDLHKKMGLLTKFDASTGWLDGFRKRFDVRFKVTRILGRLRRPYARPLGMGRFWSFRKIPNQLKCMK